MQKNKTTLILFFVLIFNSYSQIGFEKGYFINNNGEKTDCLIKNSDWYSNPKSFDYKLTENSEVLNNTITNTQEFGITNIFNFKRAIVKIDRSKDATDEINYNRHPAFTEETLFLKTLISGKASLFSYVDGSLNKYFFSIDGSKIEQLVYKSYYLDSTTIQENVQYKQQLINSLKCDGLTEDNFVRLDYQRENLMNVFLKYNKCVNSTVESYLTKSNQNEFNISVRPGISMSSMSVFNNIFYDGKNLDINFGSKTSFRFGAEFEYIFPFNKNKWAIIAEPIYQYYKAESLGDEFNFSFDYQAIDVSLGIRHYMFLKNQSKIFINTSLVSSFDFNSKLTVHRNVSNSNQSIEIKPLPTISLGFGYNYHNKFSIEFRYGFAQDLLRNYQNWFSSYNLSSLIFGYTLF